MITVSIAEFKDQFDRDFTFSETLPDIRDKDITSAINDASCIWNENIYPDEDCAKKALLYLSAHFLVTNIDASDMQGQAAFLQSSRSVNGLSESLVIPEWIQGELLLFASTAYGLRWLMMTKPYLTGVMYAVEGLTLP